jgi:hypothetical protein
MLTLDPVSVNYLFVTYSDTQLIAGIQLGGHLS